MADDELNEEMATEGRADWGKAKYDYYYTDYIDHDYPNELTSKQHKLAAIEQEEALRIQKRLLSTIDNADVSNLVFDDEDKGENIIEFIESNNRDLDKFDDRQNHTLKRKKVTFESEDGSQDEDFYDAQDNVEDEDIEEQEVNKTKSRARRPIDTAIKHNRGLTPYKNKKYRNPRIKHKLKFNKAMSKRKRSVKEYIAEYNRYTGEATGIKSSTIRSIKLC